jgi:DNA replication and repair protein RecF
MSLNSLELTNFRSYDQRRFELGSAVTLVVGPNASGKTNLLEAIYVLAITKSFRARDPELIRHEKDFFRIVGRTDGAELALGFSTEGGTQTKRVTHDQAKKTLAGHIGALPVVLFEPTDLELVTGAPEARRRYLDTILCQTDPDYVRLLNHYRRVLKQRNSLLSTFDTGRIYDEIFAWDIKLTELAAEIVRRRTQLLGFIAGLIEEAYGEVAGTREPLELSYLPSVRGENYADAFMKELAQRLTGDLAAGFTTIGPHREDFKVRFKNNDLSSVASRGETRTVVLAFKLAELAYIEQTLERKPLLLLDDVFSELDASRRAFLTKKVQDHQAIITTTQADAIAAPSKGTVIIQTAKP